MLENMLGAVKPLKGNNLMQIRIGHKVHEDDVYIAPKYERGIVNMLTTMMLQLIAKVMVQEKVLTPSEGFFPSHQAYITKALLRYLNRFRNTIQLYAEDLLITFLHNNVYHKTLDSIINSGYQMVYP